MDLYNSYFRRYAFFPFIFGMILIGWNPAAALDRGVDLNVFVQEEYNNNIFFTEDDAIEDYISTVSAGLTVYNKTERADADVVARAERLFYQDWDELDATDQFYSGKMDYRFSPRWRAGLKAGFSRDSRPDRDVATTGLVLGTDQRDKLNWGAETACYLGENTVATVSYFYEDEDYEQNAFSDMTSQQAGLEFSHNLSKHLANTYFKLYLNYNRYEYDTVDVTIYAGTVGFTRKISALWSLSISAGARYQDTEFVNPDIEALPDNDKWGAVGSLGVDYQGEYGHFGFRGSHDIASSTGLDGSTERTALIADMRYRMAEKSSVGLTTSYFFNKADAGKLATEDVDEETWHIAPYIKIAIVDGLHISARYKYSQIDDRMDDTKRTRDIALLQLVYEKPVW